MLAPAPVPPGACPPPPLAAAGGLVGTLGLDRPNPTVTPWRKPGTARIVTTAAKNTAPAVAIRGRSQPVLPVRRRWGTEDLIATRKGFSASTKAAMAGNTDLMADSADLKTGSNRDLSAARTGRRSGTPTLISAAIDLSQPMSRPRLSGAGSCAILLRIRSRPSPDGTTPSAAACNARRRRSPYSPSGSVMTPAPTPYGARPCHAPCDFSLPLC